MDLQLVTKGFDFTRKKKKWVLLLAAFGATGYSAYRVYNLPSLVRKRKRLLKFLNAFFTIAEVVSDSAETIGILSKDLKDFLQSDCDEIPNSFKQVSKIARSKEFSDSVVRVTAALTGGILRGYQVEFGDDNSHSGFYDKFMDKLFSSSGSGFASVVVGSFARNLVMAFFSNEECDGHSNVDGRVSAETPLPRWADVISTDQCRDLIGDWIQTFVTTAVTVYLDKTMNVNTYDEFFAGLTNPKHEKQVREMLISLCSCSLETLVRTSHEVLTCSNSGQKLGSDSPYLSRFVVTRDVMLRTLHPGFDDLHNVITVRKSSDQSGHSGWVSTMSNTLAVPNNKKFVLDVTGRVTFETVRSFLEVLLEKVLASVKRSVRVVKEAIVETGLRVVRYVSCKSYVVATICLSMCLRVLGDSWALMPA